MNITNKSDITYYLKKIMKEKNGYMYMLTPYGTLSINGGLHDGAFMAYQNSSWYGYKESTSNICNNIPKQGKVLFGLSEDRFLEMKDDGSAEYIKSNQTLPADTRIFMVAEHLGGMRLTIVDGNKSCEPYAIWGPRNIKTANMMATIMIALVRQYDSESADHMERFWFGGKKEKQEKEPECDLDEEAEFPW